MAPDVEPTEIEDTPIRVYVGMTLIACKTHRDLLYRNAGETEVTGFDKESLHIGGRRIPWAEAKSAFRLPHCVTVHASQSRTYSGKVRVCLGSRPGHVHTQWTSRHLNVALSRCTAAHLLRVE